MIPTMILAGLLLGVLAPFSGRWASTAGLAVLASLAWGLIVEDLVVGTALALVNVVVGVALGLALHTVGRNASRRPAGPQRPG